MLPFIVCPLQFEASLVRSALRQQGHQPNIACTGPGEGGIARWAGSAKLPPADSSVLLVGVAGSVHSEFRAGEAFVIDRIRDDSDETWTPHLRIDSGRETIITSVDRIISSRDARMGIAQRTGAHLVDLESFAFAKLATARGWRWGIVRGVSDDLDTRTPEDMERWIASDGRTRKLAVLAALARKPLMLRDLRCLHHNSKTALHRAAALIARLQSE